MLSVRTNLSAALVLSAAMLSLPAAAQIQSFDSPRYQGFDVSYCGADTESCGERMASAWCRTRGFEHASGWAARAGVDSASRAVRLDDGAVCEGAACESFSSITCGSQTQTFTMPVLGASGRATVLSPNLRSIEIALETAEYRVLIPGCSQVDPGVFSCESVLEYQHCRTLMISRMVHSCRAGLAFEAGFAEPRAAASEDYELEVNSKAKVRITPGDRGFGQIRGDADIEITFQPPMDGDEASCLQRHRYVFYPTGPMGGMSEIGEATDCEDPIEFSFKPHGDDLLRAYDLCDSFAAWDSEIEDSIEILVAGLFQIRSASPDFVESYPSGGAVIAPFVSIQAPLTIDCRL